MKKINKYIKKIFSEIIKYLYTNRLFISYILLALCGSIIVRNITINTDFAIGPILTDLGLILLIGALGYLVKPRNQYKYFLIWLIIFSILEIVNSIYYVFYASFASFAELATLSQTETVANSIFVQLRLVHFIYILQPILFYFIHNNLRKSSYYNLLDKIENKKIMITVAVILSIICLGYSFATAEKKDYGRLNKQWDRSYVVERFGIILYQFNDLFQTLKPRITSLFGYEDAYKMFQDYFNSEEREKYTENNKYSGILEGYNIVYIHMESMQNFLMDLEFNGTEVTPNLKKLAKEGLFFSNFYPQISVGTSSDAEYIMLTGLLPSSSGTVFVNYADNTFRTLASF